MIGEVCHAMPPPPSFAAAYYAIIIIAIHIRYTPARDILDIRPSRSSRPPRLPLQFSVAHDARADSVTTAHVRCSHK